MKMLLDEQYHLIYQWNDVKELWYWGLTDTKHDLVYCNSSPTQVDMLDVVIQICKSWRTHYGDEN